MSLIILKSIHEWIHKYNEDKFLTMQITYPPALHAFGKTNEFLYVLKVAIVQSYFEQTTYTI